MKLVITRPKLDAGPLAEALRENGHQTLFAPLLDIAARKHSVPHDNFQALCITSANGIRCLNADVALNTPVYAVGAQSAAAAKAKGFKRVEAHGGDVNGLFAFITAKLKPLDGPLLYISGAETSGDLEGQLRAAEFNVTRVVTYDAVAQKLDAIAHEIPGCDGVLLYSPRSAKLWTEELTRLNLALIDAEMMHYCLSPNVAAQLPDHWPRHIATQPTDASLMSLLDLPSKAE